MIQANCMCKSQVLPDICKASAALRLFDFEVQYESASEACEVYK